MTSAAVDLKKIESSPTEPTNTDDCVATSNNDDIAISPIEGYSIVKLIPSPYSKMAHVESSGESTPTADGSSENLLLMKSPERKDFRNQSPLNDIPQWKKDLILKRKLKGDRTTVADAAQSVPRSPPEFLKKKLSPISAKEATLASPPTTTNSKSSISTTDDPLRSQIKSAPVTQPSFNRKQILSNRSLSLDVALSDQKTTTDTEDIKCGKSLINKSQNRPTNILLAKGKQNSIEINTSSSSIKFETKSNPSTSARDKPGESDQTSIEKNGSEADSNDGNQMPAKLNNTTSCLNVKSAAKKYTQHINSKSPTSAATKTATSSSSSSSPSVVKTIIGEIISKGQYTDNSSNNNMIDSSSATFVKSETSNDNMAAAAAATTTTKSTQEPHLSFGKVSNPNEIDIPQQHTNATAEPAIPLSVAVDGSVTNTNTNIPPIPKRRTSLNQYQLQQQRPTQPDTKYYMATSLQTKSDNYTNTIQKKSMEYEALVWQQKPHQQQQHEYTNKATKEKEDERSAEPQQQSASNIQLPHQLHSRYESGKVGSVSCVVSDIVLTNNKNKFSAKSSTLSDGNNIENYSSNSAVDKSINNSAANRVNDGDECVGVTNAFDLEKISINSQKHQNLLNRNFGRTNNESAAEAEIKICENLNLTKNSSLSAETSVIPPQTQQHNQHHQPHHHQGYIKNPTVNKNSTATINKYIAAAAARNQNLTSTIYDKTSSNKILQTTNSALLLSPSPSSSPKKLTLSNSCVVTTTTAITTTETSSITSSLPSLSLLSNYKQPENNNQNNIIQNLEDNSNRKMVAVPEIQLKSTTISTTNSESSSSPSSSTNGGDSVTTAINCIKTNSTATAQNTNNNIKRMKKLNQSNDDTKNEDEEFNDFDPSEELQYGPGIVSKLRCRYLSLALRQSTGKQRLPLDNLRRATSLNNLLDGSGTNGNKASHNACGTGANKMKNLKNTNGTCNTIINDMIDEDNDYEHLIINSNHNHYINNKNRSQKSTVNTPNQLQNGLNNLKDIQEQDLIVETENSCSSASNSSSGTNTSVCVSSVLSNDNVEKPDQQQQQQQYLQKTNSLTSNNKKLCMQQTSAVGSSTAGYVVATAVPVIGKNSVSAMIAEKNLLNKTGCSNTINYDDQNVYNQQKLSNGNNSSQYIRNTAAAAGIIRSGRQVKRGNDSIKRARSVEALLCEKPDIWSANNTNGYANDSTSDNDVVSNDSQCNYDEIKDNKNGCSKKTEGNLMSVSAHAAIHWNSNTNATNCSSPTNSNGSPILNEVSIEDKILNAREHRKYEKHPPKRLTSVIDDTERPPPDVVKQTLKIFEASANRRGGRGITKNHQSGQVALKVANFKSIMSQDSQKPPISYPKPPLSPKRMGALNGSVTNGIKSKPNSLNIHNGCPSGNTKKFNKGSPKSGSPVSSLARKFSTQNSEDSPTENVSKSPTPLSGIASPTTLSASYLRNRNESTPIRTTPEIRAPDIIPRKIFDNSIGISPVIVDSNNQKSETDNIIPSTDSPMTQLTRKLDRLKLETPPPPPVSSILGETSRNYQSSKSSESESTDPEDEINSYDVTAVDDDEDDVDDDRDDSVDGDGEMIVKKISKTALENISKGGSTQCFNFQNVKTTPLIGKTASVDQMTPAPAPAKQVGIIRPLVAEPKPVSQPTMPATGLTTALNSNQTDKYKMSDNSIPPRPQKRSSIEANDQQQSYAHHDDNLVIKHLSQNQFKRQLQQDSKSNNGKISIETLTSLDNNSKPALTSREIEKNLINEKKNELANLESSINSLSTNTSAGTTTNNGNSELNNWQQQLSQKKKNSTNCNAGGPIEAQNNIMVFNFKDRTEVPDYIENDGLFVKRKRELPKPNESGFVLLGDLSLETSTDPDDSWTMGPPSPCNVEFENANIIIDGKSSLRFRSKDGSLRVQFDDSLTSTFEYPSELSMLDDFVITPTDTFYTNSNLIDTLDSKIQVEEIIPITSATVSGTSNASLAASTTTTSTTTTTQHSKPLGNTPIGSVPLGNYTPVKVTLQRHFELGVTRVPNASDGQSVSDFLLNEQQQQSEQNGHNNNNKMQTKSTTITSPNDYSNKTSTNGIYSDSMRRNDDNECDTTDTFQSDSDSLQYLKPASDDLTVVYSEGTQKTDLLY